MAYDDPPPPPPRNQAPAENEPAEEDGPREKLPFSQILDGLAKPIPERLLQTKRKGGNKITFCPWYRVQKILNHYTNGHWEYHVVEKHFGANRIWITTEITIHASNGSYKRQCTGTETLDTDSFGDPQSNAESQAFRRTCARFGLGLSLYES